MRSRPKSGSGIIMVVPQSATVQLVGCKVWCEIVYKGRRGYVYKDFLGGGRSASSGGKAKAKVSRANKPKAVKTDDTVDDRRHQRAGIAGRGNADDQAAFDPVAITSTLPMATSASPAIAYGVQA